MKKISSIIILIVCIYSCIAQIRTITDSKIAEVTVYTKGAQIQREAGATLQKGESTVKITGLSYDIQPRSVNVTGEGDFTILSVKHSLDFLSETKKNRRIDSLESILKGLSYEIDKIKNASSILQEKKAFLDANQNISGSNGVSVSELRLAVRFYEQEIR
ncbi:MAG: DUF4140 domain-containing protein [Bacteroidota bacterium]